MKSQVSIIEAIISAVVLFIAFNMIITTGDYQTKWKESLTSLEGRDILISADRLGKLHDYPFSPAFKADFLSKIDSIKDAVVKNETQGTVKNRIYIACDCTPDQVTYLQTILSDVKFNTRGVIAVVCQSILPAIDACGNYPNTLVIWGYKELSPHLTILDNFAKDGNSIIEIADLNQAQAENSAQQSIFGIKWISQGDFVSDQIQILKPRNSSVITYQTYKWFYHLPFKLVGTTIASSIPIDPSGDVCLSPPNTVKSGNFKFQGTDHKFWICNGATTYFDSNGNDRADAGPLNPKDKFSLGSSNFKLNYIDDTSTIRISFKPQYLFNDFLFVDNSHNKIFPLDDSKDKILLAMELWDPQTPVSAVILNKFEIAPTVWIANFARNAGNLPDLNNLGDDYKQLLSSFILSTSNKNTKETFQQVGQITSYINVNNTDMLEIYKIDLSIGTLF